MVAFHFSTHCSFQDIFAGEALFDSATIVDEKEGALCFNRRAALPSRWDYRRGFPAHRFPPSAPPFLDLQGAELRHCSKHVFFSACSFVAMD